MLRTRLIFGFGLFATLIGALWLDDALEGRPWPLGDGSMPPGVVAGLVLALLSMLASLEISAICRAKGIAVPRTLAVIAGWAGLVVCGFVPEQAPGVEAVAIAGSATLAVLVATLIYAAKDERPEGAVAAAGGVLLAQVYVGMALGFALLLRREHPAWMLLWVLAMTKSCDVGAYFTGRLIGRTKLIPWLSPGKTWEGLFGGLVLSGVLGGLGSMWLGPSWLGGSGDAGSPDATGSAGAAIGIVWGAGIGVALGLVGQLGDLMASLLKRDAGIKDSGNGLPGFGGWLDLLDSPLLAMPVAYWMLKLAVAT